MYSTFLNKWFRFSKKQMFLTDTSLCKADFIFIIIFLLYSAL